MWWKFCQISYNNEDLYEKVMEAIKIWINSTPPYSEHPQYYITNNMPTARQNKDWNTYNLLQYFEDLSEKESYDKIYDFISHFANHPAIKEIARELNIQQSNKFNTREIVEKTISDWYKTEYRLTLAKQNYLSNTKNIENEFMILSRRLADMLKTAANRWIKHHKEQEESINSKINEGFSLTDWDNEILEIYKNMKWVLEKMNVPNPTQGDISIAIQICHMGGTIMEYIPYYNEQRATRHRYDMKDMKEFLSGLSNAETIPEAEKEAYHDIIPHIQALPDTWRDYDATNWKQAKKKNTRK